MDRGSRERLRVRARRIPAVSVTFAREAIEAALIDEGAGEVRETVRIRITAKHRAEDLSQKGITEGGCVAISVLHPQIRHSTSNQAI